MGGGGGDPECIRSDASDGGAGDFEMVRFWRVEGGSSSASFISSSSSCWTRFDLPFFFGVGRGEGDLALRAEARVDRRGVGGSSFFDFGAAAELLVLLLGRSSSSS